jgi:predicted PhzF superfamily epimerase YddE/YHI9
VSPAAIRYARVSAFTRDPFAGNPAGVCPLDAWLPDELMQRIAAENAVSETAFFVARADGDLDLRWFTPATEVDLCGHATLASAMVLMEKLEPARRRVRFHTLAPYWCERLGRPALRARQVGPRGGELGCELVGDRVRLTGHAVLVQDGVFLLP